MASRYTMKIVTDFAAAHWLRNYSGVCNRLHGHNWKVEVQVVARTLDEVGMGLDFKDIKDATKAVIGELDHRNLNELSPFDVVNPTAENIAAFLYKELGQRINDARVKVDSITIWETERACVTYNEE